MAEKLRLYTTKILHSGLRVGGSKQMLSSQPPQFNFIQSHGPNSFPIVLVDSIVARGTGKE
jgi:uncharacterized glyoxalase superfamily protein PhnB